MPSSLRLDIQGLRALAVALVVIFHLSPALLQGGYIGVDVFFVISGYLITAHLLREVERTGTVRLTEFWARRARRLLPAALLVLGVSALAVLLLLPGSVVEQNLWELVFAALYVVNWNLAGNSVDYLAAHNEPSIAQHYWSLSVEEQFYIVWPVLILVAVWAAAKASRMSARTAILCALALVFASSLAFSISETARSQASAYFVTTTRAWEFAAGGLVALAPALRLRRGWHAIAGWAALAAIVGSAFSFDAATPFPGWIALVPVLGTAALLWMGDTADPRTPQYVSHAGPAQFLGDISYSAYLWHWPLIIVFTALQGRAPGWKWAVAIGAFTVLLAWLTKRFVEDPIRRAPGVLRLRLPTFAATAGGMLLIVAVAVIPIHVQRADTEAYLQGIEAQIDDREGCFGAYAILNDCDDPYALSEGVRPDVAAEDKFTVTGVIGTDRCVSERVAERNQRDCVLAAPDVADHRVLLIGDSHADHLTDPLLQVAQEAGWAAEARTRSGCSSFMGGVPEAVSSESHRACEEWGARLHEEVLGDPGIDTVIVTARSYQHSAQYNYPLAVQRLSALKAAGKTVVAVRPAPGTENEWPISDFGPKAPACAEASSAADPCAWRPPTDDWLVDAAITAGVPVIDLWDILCADGTCHALIGGAVVYFDDTHLTTTFSRTLAPWLRDELEALPGLRD
ncbi:acyltransferase family protein [Microbacterium sp. NPDC096154]|uniref:acyltransferase family protein n=1 Tax=Microbacterium sp. NPDC096154 TaxID=3155549 RepID=UPI00332C1323